ncbi:SDR family NAD(P)-dependent oxidoreductase [Nakamurella deserti]|uniref:SDR family NAD(P)-dependent oxidoreductase n=1 Tax=Nakamurella deserti TaxID=2164074 RepID=UPI000DBE9578|nr:SDR family NAD(P)-dependent oxidoreductase [Nakamurella deserti]
MEEFAGKVAVVTGGAGGIGSATATLLAQRGATVVVADLDPEAGERMAAELTATTPGTAEYRHLDVTDGREIGSLADTLVSAHGRVDWLFNNAGIVENSPTLELSQTVWDRTIAVNLTGAFLCAREFGRVMAAAGGGVIVNVSSIAGLKVVHPEIHVAYDVSKAGVAQLTRTLAVEWAPLNIRVNAVAPGYTRTPILDAVGRTDPAIVADWVGQTPQQRLMEPADIAAVVCFLFSDAASALAGHVLAADGGYMVY